MLSSRQTSLVFSASASFHGSEMKVFEIGESLRHSILEQKISNLPETFTK
jgi:hypothetical protein